MNRVIIDGSNIAHKMCAVFRDFSTSDGVPSGAAYGFSFQLLNCSKYLNATDITVCWDSKSKRRISAYSKFPLKDIECISNKDRLIEGYKFGRPNSDKVKEQIESVKKSLNVFGVRQMFIQDFEADDIAAAMCKIPFKGNTYLVSSDGDWKALMKERIFIVPSVTKNPKILTAKKFIEENGFSPEMIQAEKAFFGDKSDAIPGIPRLKRKEIYEYLSKNSIKTFKEELKNGKSKNSYINDLFSDPQKLSVIRFAYDIVRFTPIKDLELPIPEKPTRKGLLMYKEQWELNSLDDFKIDNFLSQRK